jgi:xylulokinase
MSLLLGLDIGTSSTKAILIDERGDVILSASEHHAISRPRDGWSEQDPIWWWESSRAAIQGVLGARRVYAPRITAVGLSGQMHGSVFLHAATLESGGREGASIRPALLWNDQRTSAECAEIESAVGGRAELVRRTGNAALTGFTLPKILWVRRHEPEHFARAAKILLPKDYIRWRLTGELATDVGDASGMLLFDVARRQWSGDLLRSFHLSPGLFPRVVESTEIVGRITEWAAAETGLNPGIPVVAGSGDNMCGAIGAGVVDPGAVLATLGTSGVVYAHTDSPRPDLNPNTNNDHPGRTHSMCAATGTAANRTGWCVTGCMLSAAGALEWARLVIAPEIGYERLLEEAAGVAPGCEGLVFLPYLTGERCPYPDPNARAGWIGLSARHARAHLFRAVIEGVTFGMGQILGLVRGLGVPVSRVRLGGGGAKSPLWRQIQADVYGCEVEMTNTEEGPALGAALLAGVGTGVWTSVAAACRESIHIESSLAPTDSAAYDKPRRVYERLYHDLQPAFAAMR